MPRLHLQIHSYVSQIAKETNHIRLRTVYAISTVARLIFEESCFATNVSSNLSIFLRYNSMHRLCPCLRMRASIDLRASSLTSRLLSVNLSSKALTIPNIQSTQWKGYLLSVKWVLEYRPGQVRWWSQKTISDPFHLHFWDCLRQAELSLVLLYVPHLFAVDLYLYLFWLYTSLPFPCCGLEGSGRWIFLFLAGIGVKNLEPYPGLVHWRDLIGWQDFCASSEKKRLKNRRR